MIDGHWTTVLKWLQECNKREDVEEHCPEDFLERDDAELLNKWLSLFVIELRKADGSRYPPATINLLLCGLQRYMRRNNESAVNIFDKHNATLRGLVKCMYVTMYVLKAELAVV